MSSYPLELAYIGSGFKQIGTAGETLPARSLVYLDDSGTWSLADADIDTHMPVLGITVGAISSGKTGEVLLWGFIGYTSWSWTPGADLYVSTVAGELTETAPAGGGDIVQPVAAVLSSAMILFQGSVAGGSNVSNTLEGETAFVGSDASKDHYVNYFLTDGAADDVQINAAQAYVVSVGGGSVMLEQDTFVLAAPIIPTGNDVWFKGQGVGTLIDGDALLTTEHAFHITGRSHISISDMAIQTEIGGAKTCHCIFIEDGSDDFGVSNVEILGSDDNGIHVEGTNISGGHIHDCHIVSTDGNGVYVNMDDNNTIELLHISDSDITSVGGTGIFFDASGGNNACSISNNVIASSVGVGIYVDDFTGGHISGNRISLSGSHGIRVVGSDEVNVSGNTSNANAGHGIVFDTSSDDGLIDGNSCNDNDVGDLATYDGIHIETGCTHNTVINNTCLRNNRHGIYAIGLGTQISTNLVGENGEDGIGFSGGDAQVIGNKVYDNSQTAAETSYGIHAYGSGDRAVIMGNHIDGHGDSQEHGIYLGNGAVSCLIEGNHCQDGMGSGIYLSAGNDNNSILGNYLLNNDDYGIEIAADTCDYNLVQQNSFEGNVTGSMSDGGTGTRFRTIQFYCSEADDEFGATPGKSITNGQLAYVGFHLPADLHQIMGVNLYVIPNATQASANWDLASSYGAVGEQYNVHAEAEVAATYNVTDGQLFEVDAFAAGMLASATAHDTGGVSIQVSTAGHALTLVFMEIYYV